MPNDGASGALARAVTAALRGVTGISGVSDGVPASPADAHLSLDMGPETDWGHKSGAGAEIRFAVLIRCGGDAPDRARRLVEAARKKLEAAELALEGWQLVSLALQRARTIREPGPRWTGVVEYRARLLAR